MERIDTKRGREGLQARREPYFYKLARGRYLGLRKVTPESAGTWIARYRDDDGEQRYQSLGECSDKLDFDDAKQAAETWFKECERGVRGHYDDGAPVTVATACMEYLRHLKREGRISTAHDTHMRFRRAVYGDMANEEFTPPQKWTLPPEAFAEDLDPTQQRRLGWPTRVHRRRMTPHEIATTPLAKVKAPRLRDWLTGMTEQGLGKGTANRTLASLKAALNLAVRNRMVGAQVAQEWGEVVTLKYTANPRKLFLDLEERRKLLKHAVTPALKDLLEAATLTGCRAGELTSIRRAAFDARLQCLTVTGKTGTRTFPLSPAAVTFFERLAQDRLPKAFLLTRGDGKPWAHSDWDELVKASAKNAELPAETCLYTLRHSFITQVLIDGMSTLEVSKMVGTSLQMIEKHYGHLVHSTARERLAKVQMV